MTKSTVMRPISLASCLFACGCVSRDARLLHAYQLSQMDKAAHARAPSIRQTAQLASASDDVSNVPLDRRVVIYSAGFEIVVPDVAASLEAAEKIADDYGGYVQKIDGDRITIRVRAADYDRAVERIEKIGRVVRRELESQDVTEEYVDLRARLKNAQAVRQRLEALLARAEDVKAALEVEKELKRVGEEIEQLEAKLELINNRAALSTIVIQFERVAPIVVDPNFTSLPFAWLRELDPYRLWR